MQRLLWSCVLCGCEVCPLISIHICYLKSMLFNPISLLKKENTEVFLAQRESNRKTCLNIFNQNDVNWLAPFTVFVDILMGIRPQGSVAWEIRSGAEAENLAGCRSMVAIFARGN